MGLRENQLCNIDTNSPASLSVGCSPELINFGTSLTNPSGSLSNPQSEDHQHAERRGMKCQPSPVKNWLKGMSTEQPIYQTQIARAVTCREPLVVAPSGSQKLASFFQTQENYSILERHGCNLSLPLQTIDVAGSTRCYKTIQNSEVQQQLLPQQHLICLLVRNSSL